MTHCKWTGASSSKRGKTRVYFSGSRQCQVRGSKRGLSRIFTVTASAPTITWLSPSVAYCLYSVVGNLDDENASETRME